MYIRVENYYSTDPRSKNTCVLFFKVQTLCVCAHKSECGDLVKLFLT